MVKKISFIVFLFVAGRLYSQGVTATQKFPETAVPGTDYIVELTINKTAVTGFMKFFQDVPAGCVAVGIESKGGDFSFADGGAKIIWISPPTEDQFTISYKVNVPKDISGIKNITGKVAYLDNGERKAFELETKTINIGGTTTSVITETIPVVSNPPPVIPTPLPVETKKEEPIPVPDVKKEEPAPPVAPIVKEETPIVETITKDTVAVSATPIADVKKEEPTPSAEPVKEVEKIVSTPAPIETVETKKEEIKTAPVHLPKVDNVPVTAIPTSAGKTFKVQIGAYNLKPTITGVPEPSKVVLDNGMTKYFSGNFKTYAEAAKHKKKLIEKGFQGAFVVSFEDGKILK